MNFLNLPEGYTRGRFLVLQVPHEEGMTYGAGARDGPKEIVRASAHLEYYDEQYDVEPFLEGIETSEATKDTIEIGRHFPVVLGGDHSITYDVTRALNGEFGVLIFDAHSDLRYQWNGSRYNHACVTNNIRKHHPVGIVGVRSQDKDEVTGKPSNVRIVRAYELNDRNFKELLERLPQKLYISIDVDVFDPSFIRNTGTPEPGGLFWNDLIPLLEVTFTRKEIIGADIVEFAPTENYRAEAFSLAKLAYKLMALKCSRSPSR